MDMKSVEFQEGVRKLAKQLGIARHPNHLYELEAAARIIHDKLSVNADVVADAGAGEPYPIKDGRKCAFDDKEVDQAAKILRLLQIHVRVFGFFFLS